MYTIKSGNLTPKGPKSLQGTIENFGQVPMMSIFHCDFLKLFWRWGNVLTSWGYNDFFH
jgi:hypothetical protein